MTSVWQSWRISWAGATLFASVAFCTPAFATAGTAVVEAAPLKTAYGQVSLRGETALRPRLGVYATGETQRREKPRYGHRASKRSLGAGVVWYPPLGRGDGAFVSGGMAWQQTSRGGRRRRDERTGSRVYSDELYDRWVQKTDRLMARQAVGYRWNVARYATLSLRYRFAEALYTKSRITERDVHGPGRALEANPPKPVTQDFAVFAGFRLP